MASKKWSAIEERIRQLKRRLADIGNMRPGTLSPIFYTLKKAHVDNERLTRATTSCANTFYKPAYYAITTL